MSYSAKNIEVLKGLEPVRLRPGMYIGNTGRSGLNHLIQELIDNSVDEHLAGYCKNIYVSINEDGSATVSDDGRGVPVELTTGMQYGIYDTFRRYSLCLMYINRNTPSII